MKMNPLDARPQPPAEAHKRAVGTTAQLVAQIRGGDRRAFEALFARCQERLRSFVDSRMHANLRSVTTTDDLIQEVNLVAFRDFEKFESRNAATFSSWLRGIAFHLMCRRYGDFLATLEGRVRRKSPGAVRGASTSNQGGDERLRIPDDTTGVSTRLSRAEECRRVLAVVQELPDSLRAVIMLCELEELSAQEAATALKISPNALRIRHSRALAMLQHRLVTDGAPSGAGDSAMIGRAGGTTRSARVFHGPRAGKKQ